MENIPTTGFVAKIGRWALILAVMGMICWNVYWILNNEPEHDEVEHWHAAWLMHQGKTPFYDFFEHHSPVLWMILRQYYDFFGDDYGIIIVSRLAMIALLFLTFFITYRTARYWLSPQGAMIATLGYPLLNVGYFMAHVYVRGDPLILLLLMSAIHIAAPLADKRTWERVDFEKLFLFFLLLGLALAISPRAGIPNLSLFLLLGWAALRVMPFLRLVGFFSIGGLIVLLPTIVIALPYGVEVYAFWVYKFSASILPVSSPLYGIINISKSAFPIVILTLIGYYAILRRSELRSQKSVIMISILAVINFGGLWACRHPFMQHFLMSVPFLGLMAGWGYEAVINQSLNWRWMPRWNYAKILIILALILLSTKFFIFWRNQGEATRTAWVQRSQWLVQSAGEDGNIAAATAFNGPIFMEDAFYYWFAARYASPTLQALRKDYKPYTFEQLRARRPTILHDSFASNWYLDTNPNYQIWLRNNYNPAPPPYQGYWTSKSSPRADKPDN
jgi:hypothetical protein